MITKDVIILYTEERTILECWSFLSPEAGMHGWFGMLLKGRVKVIEGASKARIGSRRRTPAIIQFLVAELCERLGFRDGMSWLE